MSDLHFRAFERRNVSAPVRVGVASQELNGRLINLGLGGAAVEIGAHLHLGSHVEIELEPPNLWDPLRLDATVVWVREMAHGFLAGISFQHESARAVGSLLGLLGTDAYA